MVRAIPDNFPRVPGDTGAELDDARSPLDDVPSPEGDMDFAFPCAGCVPPLPPAAAPASPPQAEAPSTVTMATTMRPAFVTFRVTTSPISLLRTQSAHKTTAGGGRFRR
ncbi:hypothetical protein ACGF4C_07195 [Streptomyces sp. NPDC048197]|uniref:hypothetical protein n=1 Tax=Streptomyces sp. NPDC048197 TaxID=3365511 RepID=UPI0037202DEA